jgi:hypothetical protein
MEKRISNARKVKKRSKMLAVERNAKAKKKWKYLK